MVVGWEGILRGISDDDAGGAGRALGIGVLIWTACTCASCCWLGF